jgi:hypothetical protein
MIKAYPSFLKTLLLLTLLFSSACAQATPAPAETASPQETSAVTFLDLSQTKPPVEAADGAGGPTQAPTQAPTLPPTLPPSPTFTPIPVVIATNSDSGCTNQAVFVKHLTVSYDTAFKPGEFFAKMWQVLNVGSCTWSTDYRLVFIGGESMQAAESIPLPHEVKPQETVDLRVNLVAPENPNLYENSWMLQDADGHFFGVGPDHSEALFVKISVPQIHKPKPL